MGWSKHDREALEITYKRLEEKPQPLFVEGVEVVEREGKVYLIVRFSDGSVKRIDAVHFIKGGEL